MGTELVPETLYSNELTRLCAREDYIESCRRESFKTSNSVTIHHAHFITQVPASQHNATVRLFYSIGAQ
jgi:hypothetical protein